MKRYAEALTLLQHATIHIRETNTTLAESDADPISTATPPYFPLHEADLKELEGGVTVDGLQFKRDWFAFNGGSTDADGKTYQKPLFFNIALNYVELDMERLLQRAGKQSVVVPSVPPAQGRTEPVVAEKKPVAKAKVEEVRAATPEPQAQSRGGLSSLLGGWWGKS